ncbi:hypothetical protein Q427_24990 [Halomonas sp. BC04]|nr:hypothetical protein Q427_24990 [Halomonas sp. BC04]
MGLELAGERLPGLHFQHHAEMRYRHAVPIDRVGMAGDRGVLEGRVEVTDELVSEQVEIDPAIRGSTSGQPRKSP